MRCVTLLEVLDDTQRVKIVIEAAPVMGKTAVECAFARMAEGRVADVVDEREYLREIYIEAQCACGGAGDLGNLDGVGQAAAEVIGGPAGEHLSLPRQPAKGTSLDDALAITLEGRTRGASRRAIDARVKRVARISGDRVSMEIE